MNELYWITRFDALHGLMVAITIAFGVLAFIFIVAFLFNQDDGDTELANKFLKRAFKFFIVTFISGAGIAFIPTTKEALVIYGVGGTIDYVKSDSTAKQLPKKAILALDKYLNEITDDKN